jgi:hypothetical protein
MNIDDRLRDLIDKMPNINMSGKMAFRELLWQMYDNNKLTQADIQWMEALITLFTDAFQDYEGKLLSKQMHELRLPECVEDYVGRSGD